MTLKIHVVAAPPTPELEAELDAILLSVFRAEFRADRARSAVTPAGQIRGLSVDARREPAPGDRPQPGREVAEVNSDQPSIVDDDVLRQQLAGVDRIADERNGNVHPARTFGRRERPVNRAERRGTTARHKERTW